MNNPVVLAFSGGLDTSYCIPWLKENFAAEVVTVTVNTGGFSPTDLMELEQRSYSLGSLRHISLDARAELFDRVLRYLIYGNVRKGEVYPLSVGSERSMQAEAAGRIAENLGANAVAHGCTAAGNDQVRFEIALRSLYPALDILAPVRDQPVSRSQQVAYLEDRGLTVPKHGADYSINRGLWGTTIGGVETLLSSDSIPEHVWPLSAGALERQTPEKEIELGFEFGQPSSINGQSLAPVEFIEVIDAIASDYAIGRGIHLGDTILGIKGRVAFEAPAAEVIISAHRELEKLVLSGKQLSYKTLLSNFYAELIHTGNYLDPVCTDIESFLESSQRRVTGSVYATLRPGNLFITGCDAPASLMQATEASYGEAAVGWTAEDASGFCKISAIAPLVYHTAEKLHQTDGTAL